MKTRLASPVSVGGGVTLLAGVESASVVVRSSERADHGRVTFRLRASQLFQ